MLANHILKFYQKLKWQDLTNINVEVLAPFKDPMAQDAMRDFFWKFYSDNDPRIMLVGINPGRFGGGTTGIPFTDPINLETYCGIKNNFDKKHELSSKYIYDLIEAYGGPALFYKSFYFYSVSPVGFTQNGKNFNYYDDKLLKSMLEVFIVESMEDHFKMGMRRDVAFSLGQGQNVKILNELNEKYKFFNKIIPLPHPRWVMQYKLKKKEMYIDRYITALTSALNSENL